jgi:hypothetical protein
MLAPRASRYKIAKKYVRGFRLRLTISRLLEIWARILHSGPIQDPAKDGCSRVPSLCSGEFDCDTRGIAAIDFSAALFMSNAELRHPVASDVSWTVDLVVSWFGAHSDELTPFLEGHLGSELIRMSLPLFSTSYGCCTERYRHSLRMVSADCFEINRKVSKQWFFTSETSERKIYIYG